MSMEERDGNCHKMSQMFFCRPLPAARFWLSPTEVDGEERESHKRFQTRALRSEGEAGGSSRYRAEWRQGREAGRSEG